MSMYRPPAFAVDDSTRLHAFIRERVFATVAVAIDDGVKFAYAPVVLDGAKNSVRFHLAVTNAVAKITDGTPIALSWLGPDSYVSPDWYETLGRVPTWNYCAVEGRGVVRRVSGDALRQLLIDLSAAEEEKLLPKKPWTIDKVPGEKMAGLLNGIVGFEVALESLEGKFKLSQNVPVADMNGVIHRMERRSDAASIAVAREMRAVKP